MDSIIRVGPLIRMNNPRTSGTGILFSSGKNWVIALWEKKKRADVKMDRRKRNRNELKTMIFCWSRLFPLESFTRIVGIILPGIQNVPAIRMAIPNWPIPVSPNPDLARRIQITINAQHLINWNFCSAIESGVVFSSKLLVLITAKIHSNEI